jgi:hypothetical protein
MNFSSILKRLRGVEQVKGAAEATLVFANNSTRAIRVRSRNGQLKLCLDAFAKMRAFPPDPPPGVIPLPEPPPPELTTPSDKLIDLMAAAESVEGPAFFRTIFELCQTLGQRRKEKLLQVPLQGKDLS